MHLPLIEQQKNIRKHKILLLTGCACKRGISIEALTSLNSGRCLGSSCQQSCSNLVSLSGTCEGISGRRPLIEELYPLVRNTYSDNRRKFHWTETFRYYMHLHPVKANCSYRHFKNHKLQVHTPILHIELEPGSSKLSAFWNGLMTWYWLLS